MMLLLALVLYPSTIETIGLQYDDPIKQLCKLWRGMQFVQSIRSMPKHKSPHNVSELFYGQRYIE